MTHEQTYSKKVQHYIYGGIIAAILTGVVYTVSVNEWLSGTMLALFALTAAAIQLVVHLTFFVHVRDREGPNWSAMSFAFTVLTALIIVVGSLWIMLNLNYNMGMTPEQMDEFMIKQGSKGF